MILLVHTVIIGGVINGGGGKNLEFWEEILENKAIQYSRPKMVYDDDTSL